MNAARSRRDLRQPETQATAIPKRTAWSRRRGAMATFSIIAAAGFAAAYLVPTASAIANGAPAEDSATATQYSAASSGARSFVADDAAVTGDVKRDSYEVYVKPKPKPKPTVEVASVDEGSDGDGGGKSDGGGQAASPMYSGGGAPSDWMSAAGIAPSDYGYVDYIVSRESGWNPNATNAGSGACGLVQALPCSKVPGGGYNPVANLRWANGYAVGRYGSWAAAYSFWTNNHWW